VPESLELVPYTYSFCRHCDRRVDLGRIAYGETIKCPGCGFEFAILRQSPSLDATVQGRGGQGGQPRKAKPEKPPVPKTKKRKVKKDVGDKMDSPTFADTKFGVIPSPTLFLFGTFTFPWHPRSLCQTLTLSVGAAVLVAAIRIAAWCIGIDDEAVDPGTRVLLWNGILLSIVLGTMVSPALLYAASVFGMTALRDTSCGAKSIASWPNLLALEGLGEIVFVVLGLNLSCMPGLLLAPLWKGLGVPMPWGIGVLGALLFPIMLMSELQADSCWQAISRPVLQSLFRAWPAWVLFHLTTVAASAAAAWLGIAAFRHVGMAAGVLIAGFLIASGWMIYFRLLGRLAWFCLDESRTPEN
jgi:hypothetical protein